MTCKVSVITDEILCKYHPLFINAPKKYITWFKQLNEKAAFSRSIGNLVAEALAHASSTLEYTDVPHMDYQDGTDMKVIALTNNCVKIKVGECGNITKTGDLRVVIFNDAGAELLYLYIPYDFWINKVREHKGLFTLNFTYSKKTKKFTQGYDKHIVSSFKKLVNKVPA